MQDNTTSARGRPGRRQSFNFDSPSHLPTHSIALSLSRPPFPLHRGAKVLIETRFASVSSGVLSSLRTRFRCERNSQSFCERWRGIMGVLPVTPTPLALSASLLLSLAIALTDRIDFIYRRRASNTDKQGNFSPGFSLLDRGPGQKLPVEPCRP